MSEDEVSEQPKASVPVLARNMDFLKVLHEDERNRATRLGQLGTTYLGLEGLYIGAIAFKFADVAASANSSGVPLVVFLGSLGAMVIALALTTAAIAIKVSEGLAKPDELAKKLEKEPDTEEVFLMHRCTDFAAAAYMNSAVNDKRAALLQLAGWAIVVSIGVHACGIGWALTKSL